MKSTKAFEKRAAALFAEEIRRLASPGAHRQLGLFVRIVLEGARVRWPHLRRADLQPLRTAATQVVASMRSLVGVMRAMEEKYR
jgi:hypothetical protein